MLCPKCRNTIPDGSRFCLECGSAVSSDPRAQAAQARLQELFRIIETNRKR
jgi:predicted amidophosphoribosyltransferase